MEASSNAILSVRQGQRVSKAARMKYEIVGNWDEVLASDKLHVLIDDSSAPDEAAMAKWTEGPLWAEHEKAFYFSSPTTDRIWKLGRNSANGTLGDRNIWATEAGGIDPNDHPNVAEPGSNGMASDPNDPQSAVYICQQGKRRIIRCRLSDHVMGMPLESCPGFEVIADKTPDGRPFNSPNDVVVSSNTGNIWFTDPIYGFLEKDRFADTFDADGGSYLDNRACSDDGAGVKGVYCWNRGTRRVELVSAFHRRPNGLALTPDESSLWIADSTIGCPSWTRYDVVSREDGSTALGKCAKQVITPAVLGSVLGAADGCMSLLGTEGLSDGFKIDEEGRIWTSMPNGFAIIDPNADDEKKLVCQILLGVNTSNVTFGSNGDVFFTGQGVWQMERKLS